MESFCSTCKKITLCEITNETEDFPTITKEGRFRFDKATKCNMCTKITPSYVQI